MNKKEKKHGKTALMVTCNIEAIKVLLDTGADVDAVDKYGLTTLMH